MSRQTTITVHTRGRGTTDITREVERAVAASGVECGIAQVFVQHTSASLMICENADPQVRNDLETFLARLVPDGATMFRHDAEGPDDMPAHVRAVLTKMDLTVPVEGRRLALGTWQGIYLYEHRTHGHARRIVVTVIGA